MLSEKEAQALSLTQKYPESVRQGEAKDEQIKVRIEQEIEARPRIRSQFAHVASHHEIAHHSNISQKRKY